MSDHAARLNEIADSVTAGAYRIIRHDLRAAAAHIEELEAQVREQGCKECAELGHHPKCDGYIPSLGELLNLGEDGAS